MSGPQLLCKSQLQNRLQSFTIFSECKRQSGMFQFHVCHCFLNVCVPSLHYTVLRYNLYIIKYNPFQAYSLMNFVKGLCLWNHHHIQDIECSHYSTEFPNLLCNQFSPNSWSLPVGNRSKHGKCGSAPTRKSQWEVRLVGRTHVHGWGIRLALYIGCYETCSC